MADRAPVVVAISRQIASGGAYIGQSVANRLQLKYVDREILQRAAEALGAEDEKAIEALEERRPGAWAGIARALFVGAPDTPFVPPPPPHVHEGVVLAVETRIICEIAERESSVIVGRGAAHVLPHRPGIIRVFLHAPVRVRVKELQRAYQLSEADAKQLVQRSDKNRAGFVQSITGRSWTDSCLYDLCVDTSVVAHDAAAALIVAVAGHYLNTSE